MATGQVGRIKANGREQIQMTTWVFAGANSLRGMSRELLDRFTILELAEYDRAAYTRVVASILVRREGQDPELAQEVAMRLAQKGSRSVRRAVDIVRMAGGDRRLAGELIARLIPG
jgi:DNA helicase TIP49 (TBP-interacting protein)